MIYFINKPAWLNIGMSLVLILSPVQDTFLQETPLRVAGGSPSFLALFLIMSAFGVYVLINAQWLRRIPLWAILYALFFMCINFYYAAVFSFEYHGVNLLWKGVKFGVLLGAFASVVWLFSSYSVPKFHALIRLTYGLALLGLLIDFLFHNAWVHSYWFHYSVQASDMMSNRPRGLSSESSTLGITLGTLGLLCSATASTSMKKTLWVIVTFISVCLSESKAGPLLMAGSLMLAGYLLRSISLRKTFLMIAGTAFALIMFRHFSHEIWDTYVIGPFANGLMHNGVSVITRGTLAVSGYEAALSHPWGVGLTGYFPVLVEHISHGESVINSLFDMKVNFSEVNTYIYQNSAKAVSTKSLFLDCLIVFGFPFAFIWFWKNLKLIRIFIHQGDLINITLLIMIAGALMTYVPGIGIYPIAIAYGWLIRNAAQSKLIMSVRRSYRVYELERLNGERMQ